MDAEYTRPVGYLNNAGQTPFYVDAGIYSDSAHREWNFLLI
jgi:hypothetical protein